MKNNVKGIKGSNDLDTPMKDNPSANKDPDMGKSMGADPKPDMEKGYSPGSLDMPDSVEDDLGDYLYDI